MKKTVLAVLLCVFVYNIHAQCPIDPFIQQNYEIDAKILALREIRDNPSDVDYNNPFIPDARVTPYLEKLSAIYNNPQNLPEVDSLFNEFQFRVNHVYGYLEPVVYKSLVFRASTSLPWIQTFKDTGVSGVADLDNLINQYQLSISNFLDLSSSGNTLFYLTTSYDFLNIRAILDDFEAVPDVDYAEPLVGDNVDPIGINYTGVAYNIVINPLPGVQESFGAAVCDIKIINNNVYEFFLAGGDCFAGCLAFESRYVTISDDCSTVGFSMTLSTEENELANIVVYPNPVANRLHIEGITNVKNIEIYSILGKQIQVALNNATIDVSNFQTGTYFLKVTDDQNRSIIKKFIKQ
ncbi:MAG: T9SS type A sorting domain-containing protein [Bacteroidota bacterium]